MVTGEEAAAEARRQEAIRQLQMRRYSSPSLNNAPCKSILRRASQNYTHKQQNRVKFSGDVLQQGDGVGGRILRKPTAFSRGAKHAKGNKLARAAAVDDGEDGSTSASTSGVQHTISPASSSEASPSVSGSDTSVVQEVNVLINCV